MVDLALENLSPLYKGFFGHTPFVEQLATDLAPHVASRSVTVKVIWDGDEDGGTGSIQLLVPDGEATLTRAGQRLADERWLDPAPLAPYVSALDSYRNALGERYDLRLLSFALALELWDPHSECRCLWPVAPGDAAEPEMDSQITCRDPFGKTLELTRDGETWPAPIDGTKRACKALAGALGH